MKKSSLIIILLAVLYCGFAQAEKNTNGKSLYSPEIKYSETLKYRIVKKIENEPEYIKMYFQTALILLRSEIGTK